MQFHRLFYLIFFICFSLYCSAQNVKDTPKIKPPKMEAFWGDVRGGNISIEKALKLADTPFIVIAERRESMKISRAIFIYRSKDTFEDEETGKLKSVYNSSSYDFRNENSLPEKLRNFLKENIKSGDQLILADIIVRDKKNNLFKAGDIRIIIE